jgi:hypothetical protein
MKEYMWGRGWHVLSLVVHALDAKNGFDILFYRH